MRQLTERRSRVRSTCNSATRHDRREAPLGRGWPRAWVGACALWAGVLGLFGGCTVEDLEYCSDSSDCPGIVGAAASSQRYVCHPTRHVCIPFLSDTCFKDADCHGVTAPRCNTDPNINRCEPCVLGDANDVSCSHLDTTPYCGSAPGGGTSCVECLKSTDCPASRPICDGQACRPCSRHTDCEGDRTCDDGKKCTDSLVCIGGELGPDLAGRCAQNGTGVSSGRVVYVFSKGDCSDTDGRQGADLSKPFCSIDPAVAIATSQSRRYIRVVGSGPYDQPAKALQDGTLVYIGSPVPSRGINSPATVTGRMTPAFAVNEQGNLTVDEFDLLELISDHQVVTCSGLSAVPTLTLKNSTLRGTTAAGDTHVSYALDLQNCQARISGNVIGLGDLTQAGNMTTPSNSRGLRILDTGMAAYSYLIENNVIAGNWLTAVDFYYATPSVTFRFNTVANNGRVAGGFGGIVCPTPIGGPIIPLTYSIVVNNMAASGSQLTNPDHCSFKQLVIGPNESVNNPQLIKSPLPDFDTGFALLSSSANNQGCCIDKIQPSMSETYPATDLARNTRPQGAGYDIGAYEVVVSK